MQLQRQIDRLLAQRASEWHQILETADDERRAEFVAWLKQSPLHLNEYLEIVYADQVLQHVDAQHREDVDALIARIAPTVVPFAEAPLPAPRRIARWKWGLAAGLALCVLSALFIYEHFTAKQEFATTIGEQRTIQLPDASIITLNADSQIEVHLNETERHIELLRGEALFTVARDAHRPFRVHTRRAVVQAVGTQFNVYERPDGTLVSVLEGRVNVISNAAGGTASLGAGEEARITPTGTVRRDIKANVAKTVAWREHRLIFEDAPLEEMVREFNRYNRATRLRLEGVPPGTHHYNGIFNAADPDSLAELLSREPDLSVARASGEIVIRPRR